MKYIYYDLNNQKIVSEKNKPYLVYGKLGKLPEGVVELIKVETPPPSYNQLIEKLSFEYIIDEENKEYRKEWNIIEKTTFEIMMEDWKYPEFQLRVVAPVILANHYPQIEVWFRLNNLPIEVHSNMAYLYCNVIQPFHQELIDLHNEVYVENIPNIDDY